MAVLPYEKREVSYALLEWRFATQFHDHNVLPSRAREAKPNAAHMVIAALSVKETLRQICSSAESFTLVTQNVDGLSRRALDQLTSTLTSKKTFEKVTPEPQSIIEIHGRIFDTVCRRCRHREANHNSPICAALEGTDAIVEKQEQEPDIPLSDLPRCTKPDCGGLLRPGLNFTLRVICKALPVTKILSGVVWFGEMPHHLQEIDEVVRKADLAIVVGTSSTVRSTEEDHEFFHHLMTLLARYTLLPVMHPQSESTEVQLLYSISTGATAIARRTTSFLDHALKLYLKFSPAINRGLMIC